MWTNEGVPGFLLPACVCCVILLTPAVGTRENEEPTGAAAGGGTAASGKSASSRAPCVVCACVDSLLLALLLQSVQLLMHGEQTTFEAAEADNDAGLHIDETIFCLGAVVAVLNDTSLRN